MPASRTWHHFESAALLPGLYMGGTDDHLVGRELSRADLQKSRRPTSAVKSNRLDVGAPRRSRSWWRP